MKTRYGVKLCATGLPQEVAGIFSSYSLRRCEAIASCPITASFCPQIARGHSPDEPPPAAQVRLQQHLPLLRHAPPEGVQNLPEAEGARGRRRHRRAAPPPLPPPPSSSRTARSANQRRVRHLPRPAGQSTSRASLRLGQSASRASLRLGNPRGSGAGAEEAPAARPGLGKFVFLYNFFGVFVLFLVCLFCVFLHVFPQLAAVVAPNGATVPQVVVYRLTRGLCLASGGVWALLEFSENN